MIKRFLKMSNIQTRSADDGSPVVEGYFAVFDEVYEIFAGASESIAKGAFADSIKGDVRALYNHNHDLVLGRKSAGTLTLREDDKGLWGQIIINQNDSEAMNAYERIKRGDITGCSFGFDIAAEIEERNEDGSIHWTITKADPLYEVSPCVFPAYEGTSISSRADANSCAERKARYDEILADDKTKRDSEWKASMRSRLRGDNNNGIKTNDAPKED